MQKKYMTVFKVDFIDGGESDIIFHGTSDNTNVRMFVNADTIAMIADLYKVAGHSGHAIWHLNNKEIAMPCPQCHGKVS